MLTIAGGVILAVVGLYAIAIFLPLILFTAIGLGAGIVLALFVFPVADAVPVIGSATAIGFIFGLIAQVAAWSDNT